MTGPCVPPPECLPVVRTMRRARRVAGAAAGGKAVGAGAAAAVAGTAGLAGGAAAGGAGALGYMAHRGVRGTDCVGGTPFYPQQGYIGPGTFGGPGNLAAPGAPNGPVDVPEPATWLVLGASLAALLLLRAWRARGRA